jgi:hypothetical protein
VREALGLFERASQATEVRTAKRLVRRGLEKMKKARRLVPRRKTAPACREALRDFIDDAKRRATEWLKTG